ncbi:C40 family peptidase [Streptomyces albipurpureus]|uniref:NlpC/P60 family protein n=1 Tax=Streptomyces albipurpureus TaxID=2897419 RepID=A0ABT0V0I1_9ACTN|nr:C40 family peptidase [Streptomyces sp. CWNU-1]MCM2394245.1 NlpC/P60 family protein [Streptomyces sp. CWNU-1]
MNRRHCATAAIALVCALTVLTAPGTAFASPLAPGPPAAAPGAPLLPKAPEPLPRGGASGTAPAAKKTLDEVRLEIEGLYHQAVSATDAYNLAEEQAKKQSAEIGKLAQRIIQGQARIDDLKLRAGAAARAQYQSGGLPPEAHLMLTDDPRLFLDGASRIKDGMKATRDLMRELEQTQADLESYTKDAGTEWRKLEANRVRQAKAKKEIATKIAAAEAIEGRLKTVEHERMLVLERQAAEKAQREWMRSTPLQETAAAPGAAASQGETAVEFARSQIGKPYEWGAEGPGSYDCSGLTSQAWAAAGQPIPRTSQEQWRQLPKVAVESMQPGDLIIYHADASHVGMYVGDGTIVHAPRPGRNVTLTGAGSMKILGVVRP